MATPKYEYHFRLSDDAKKVFGANNKHYQLHSDVYVGTSVDDSLANAFGSKGLPNGLKKSLLDNVRTRVYLEERSQFNNFSTKLDLGSITRVDANATPPPPAPQHLPMSAAQERASGKRFYADFFTDPKTNRRR